MPTGQVLPPNASDGVDTAAESTSRAAQVLKKARPFRFEDGETSSSKKFWLSGNAPKIAGLAIVGVLTSFGAYSFLRKNDVQSAVAPFTTPKVEISKLKSISENSASASVPEIPASSPQIAVAAQEPVIANPQEPASTADTVKPADQAAISQQKTSIAGAETKAVRLPSIEHFQVVLLIKKIDETEALVEFNGKEFLVKPGQTFPDNETVFVGFETSSSVMRTTAGDYKVFNR